MKKLFLIISSLLLMSGCTFISDKADQAALKEAGIFEEEDYLQYQQLLQQEKLDENGYYIYPEDSAGNEQNMDTEGMVHVNLTENIYLQISYYKDKDHHQPLNRANAYLKPGESIYYSTPLVQNTESKSFSFDHFVVQTYNGAGTPEEKITCNADKNGLLYQIPADYTGNRITVYPLGQYTDTRIYLNVYLNKEDKPVDLGQWTINDTRVNDDDFYATAFEEYTVKYYFNHHTYRFVDSVPTCFTDDPDQNGVVEFYKTSTADGNTSYKVILERLNNPLEVTLTCDAGYTTELDGQNRNSYVKNEKTDYKIGYGQTLAIESEGMMEIEDTTIKENCFLFPQKEANRYLIIHSENAREIASKELEEGQFLIQLPANDKYGSYTYKLEGQPVFGIVAVRPDQKLKITCKLRKGFRFSSLMGNLMKSKSRTIELPEETEVLEPYRYFEIESR